MRGFWGMRGAIAALSGVAALVGVSSAAVIEVIDVDNSNPDGVQTTTILEEGVEYQITVSGVVVNGDGILADAEYVSSDNFATIRDINTNWNVDIGLTIDGALIDWGAFNLDHVYTVSIIGAGAPLLLAFLDTFYHDNVGYLTVTISNATMLSNPVPGAAVLFGTALLGGAFRLRKRKTQSA